MTSEASQPAGVPRESLPVVGVGAPALSPFHDGGTATEPPRRDRAPVIVLERVVTGAKESFRLGRRLGFTDAHLGELLVPADLTTFTTDLTSVPMLFRWLVPRTGTHLPAALLHDGLVHPRGSAPTYVAERGVVVDRVAADRVFRDAMRDLDTPVLRRWLVWSAVTLATITVGSQGWSRREHLRYLVPMVATLLLVAGVGVLATLDLLDVVSVLPWQGERPWWVELLAGGLAAVVLPALAGLTWGRFRLAGVVSAVALALLLHVTVALALLYGLYLVAEAVAERVERLRR